MFKQHCNMAARDRDGLAIIGMTKHQMMGIRYVEGEGGNTPPAGGDGDKGGQAQNDGVKPNESSTPWTKDNFDPERAGKLVENLRGDLATEKQKRDQAIKDAVAEAEKNILGNISKALGGGEQTETDPDKLNASLSDLTSKFDDAKTTITAKDAEIKANQVALQVALHAPELGANTALLLKNEQFKNSIGQVEPTDEAAIKAAITKALQDNAALKQPPARSGAGEHTGPTVQSLKSQLEEAEKNKDYAETIRLKRAISRAQA
ncbi:hypothetical protein [Paramicrobacterium chengjingii]|uniref:Scaffolding protein n=1 Tax=Paramicrobacterium chengjingii TaxID=2769067 RepID=A0ABX6YMV2_9MICO|nr:hypothetical protein [Microbacterium chengjingii]QPZ39706.1 hypothetical protein HCR76_06585 [Microbacterium chengjingii]